MAPRCARRGQRCSTSLPSFALRSTISDPSSLAPQLFSGSLVKNFRLILCITSPTQAGYVHDGKYGRKGITVFIIIAAIAGLVAGEVMRRRLNRLGYRLAEGEDGHRETDLPLPGRRLWIPAVLAVAWGSTVWVVLDDVHSPAQWVRTAGWLVFTAIGLWLGAIDLDVRRLPDAGQIWLAVVAVVGGVILNWDHPTRLLVGLGAAVACGLAFLIIHVISRGNLGLGDVKLIMTCGWWLGLSSWTAVYAGLVAGCLLAVVYAAAARVRQFAFGPWLVAGTLAAGLIWT